MEAQMNKKKRGEEVCLCPPTMYFKEAPFLLPEVSFYNSVFQFRNPRAMLEALDNLENPEEEKINEIVDRFFMDTFGSFLNAKDTVLDYSLQQLLRHRVVDELKWFENHHQLTALKPLKYLYPHTCCVCLERGVEKSRALFGELFDELWDMVWPDPVHGSEKDLNRQVETIYRQMYERIKATEVAGRVDSLIRDQIKLFQKFFLATLKDGGSAKSAFWNCCKHVNN